jgi:hypothetical protein
MSFLIFENNNEMIQTEMTINPPTFNTIKKEDSDAVFISSIIFKNEKYRVEGRKFGMDSIYWDIEELGFVITSNKSPIVFSFNELDTAEITQTFAMWHEAGMRF